MLILKNISIAYNKDIVVDNFNMEIDNNEIVCIVGESGCGKTSILKSIIGILPDVGKVVSGDILFNNSSILNLSNSQMNELRGKEIAMVFQDAGLSINPIRKIGSQFIQYIRTHTKVSKKEAYELALLSLEKMNLQNPKHIMDSYIFNLSGGMKQRVGIAFGMSLQPKLLLLDEPTSALDVITGAAVIEEIIKLRENYDTSILLITHNIPLAVYVANKIIVMKDGSIVEANSASRIFNNPLCEYTKELIASIPNFEE